MEILHFSLCPTDPGLVLWVWHAQNHVIWRNGLLLMPPSYCCHQSAGDRDDPELLLLLPPSHADPHTLQSLLWASRKQTLNSVTGLSLQTLCHRIIKSTPNLSFQHSSWLQSSAFCPPFSLPTHGCVFATKDGVTLLCLNHSNKLG